MPYAPTAFLAQPYSWPKDHPGRAEAIAKLKAERKAGKVVGTAGNARFVKKAASVDEEVVTAAGVEKSLDGEEPGVTTPDGDVDVAVVAEEGEEAKEVKEDVFEESSSEDVEDAVDVAGTTAKEVEDVVEEEMEDAENVEGAEDVAVSEEEETRMKAAEEKVAAEKATREKAAKERVDKLKADAARKREHQPKGRLDDDLEKEQFVDEEDKLPEAKELDSRVLDPVTGEMVSQDEFRNRVKTRGVVKDHVSKFEEEEVKAAKEKAEFEAQFEARKGKAVKA